ncbi:hypothetical protein IAU60_000902 [Kwoniella sp. DSM 27419]
MSGKTGAQRAFSVSSAFSSSSLSRLASQTQPELQDLNLSNLLNGDTCPPISFPDFAAFVANKEFTSENLLFILWFRSYRARFDQLDQKVKETIPIPSTRLGDRYDPYGYLDRTAAAEANGQAEKQEEAVVFNEPFAGPSSSTFRGFQQSEPSTSRRQCLVCSPAQVKTQGTPCVACQSPARRTSRLFSITSLISSRRASSTTAGPREIKGLQSILHATTHPPLPPKGTVYADPAAQPMREEAQRAFATFLRKGGSRELGISDEMRQFTKICLARSTAPEVFAPLYEEIYHVVETQSLPHFFQHAKTNINRPKQLFWYMVGGADFAFGVVIYLLLTLLLPTRPFGVRAYRLFSVIFVTFGVMQAYSAYRGFCSQVWGRSHRQLRPWEMDDLDDEEAMVEHEGEMEMKEERSATSGLGPGETFGGRARSRETMAELDVMSFPSEVRPLADVGGITRISSDAGDYKENENSPCPSKTDTVAAGLPILEGHETEAERRQSEIRRTTVKAPSPSDAFPISDHAAPFAGIDPPRLSFQTTDARTRREISPFVMEDNGSIHSNAPQRRLSPASAVLQGAPLTRSKSSLPSMAVQRTSKEIQALLMRLRRASPHHDGEDSLDPLAPVSGGPMRRGTTDTHAQGQAQGQVKKVKVFGPEKLVEDPRIKKVYSDIKRDILIVGSFAAIIWIALCLAVPCKGLASK